jgi:hypothetical protein
MNRLEQRRKFLNLLFDQDDKIAWGMGKRFVRARDPYPEFLHTNENMMCINPCTYRRFDKITNVYSLLFEVDKDMTPKQQVKKIWWTAIAKALSKHGIIADEATKAVGQISRLPGSLNEKTNKEQKLLLLRDRVTHEEMLQWLKDNM